MKRRVLKRKGEERGAKVKYWRASGWDCKTTVVKKEGEERGAKVKYWRVSGWDCKTTVVKKEGEENKERGRRERSKSEVLESVRLRLQDYCRREWRKEGKGKNVEEGRKQKERQTDGQTHSNLWSNNVSTCFNWFSRFTTKWSQ